MKNQTRDIKTTIYQLALSGLMTAIICILAPMSIPIPFSLIPISFTNLAIYFTVFIIGWKRGTISYLVYLLIGLVGLPVFSGFEGGVGKIAGPTGGYLIGFIFMTMICGIFVEKFTGKIYMYVIGMIIGTCVAYGFGAAWLAYQTNRTFVEALLVGVVPYLLGDGIKIVVACIAGPMIRKVLLKAGLV